MKVAVIGTGYVGLVSGACLADLGHAVTCVDVDPVKVEKLRQGIMPIYEAGLEEVVKRNVAAGRLFFTTSYADAIPGAEVISVAVGTPSASDGSVDMQYVHAAMRSIARHLSGYAVIANKSTVPVDTADACAHIVKSIYPGEFDVVSNPEFLREGHAVEDFMHPDRIIIGSSSPRAAEVMKNLYAFIDCQKIVMSVRSAELTKYAANAFLATKISFMNEIAHLAEEVGADVEEVAHGIGTDRRIGKEFLRAGLGWGGSCFPKDVRALRHLAEKRSHPLPIVNAAFDMNERARLRVVERMEKALGNLSEKNIGLLGLAFKNNTDDTRESPAIDILKHLLDRGARVSAFDPAAVMYDAALCSCFVRVNDVYEAAEQADALVIATEWDLFRVLDLSRLRRIMRGNLIVDARNLLDPGMVERANLAYLRVGRR